MESTAALIGRARYGDVDAYGEIVRRFQDMGFGYAYSVLGDFHLAEDAAQAAFIQAYRDLAKLREPAAFPGWFRRIVFKCCDRLTRRWHVSAVALETAAEAASAGPGPPELAERREVVDAVLAALEALPAQERTVTTLFYINGYSQSDIAEFLEVPVTTVNNRLHASRTRLRKRMLGMVEEALKRNAPDERFSTKVIRELLARPRLLEIEGHPVKAVWDMVKAALPEYEVVTGPEVERTSDLDPSLLNEYRAYHLDGDRSLRTQTTSTTVMALKGRTPPVRLLAAGRCFRPEREDATHSKVFHQVDGLCVEAGADAQALKRTAATVLGAIFGAADVRWRPHKFACVEGGLEVDVELDGTWYEIAGSGTLKAATLRDAGFDPSAVTGFAFGLGLERLAMIKFGIDDIHALWRPPYVPERHAAP